MVEESNTWQNNLVRVSFLVTCISIIVIIVFFILVFAGSNPGNAGAIAVPLMVCSLVGVLIGLTGLAIEREKVKHRLPKVKVKHIILLLLGTVLFLGLKSFMFGYGVGIILIMSVYLLKGFESRLRGIAVCCAMMCLVVAEAIRRGGGYDSGGFSRHVQNCYSLAGFFFPGMLLLSTFRKRPMVTLISCIGFGVLTLHMAGVLCSAMTAVLDDTLSGRKMTFEHDYEDYCIMSTISSPLGLVVETFQATMFPPYEYTPTVKPTMVFSTTTTTTTTLFDCSLLDEEYIPDENSTENITNGTRYFRKFDGVDVSHYQGSLEGVDYSHCLKVHVAVEIDPNSTTTSTTSTTSTTTTSTTSTSTSTTSTTTTSTTSTTTTTTTTTTSTTSTTTTTITTTANETATMTTTVQFDPRCLPPWTMIGDGCFQKVTTLKIPQVKARQYCKALGPSADLAWLDSAEQSSAVKNWIGESRAYMGLQESVDGEWQWIHNGKKATWLHWGPGEPKGGTSKCASMYFLSGEWSSAKCTNDPATEGYICRKALERDSYVMTKNGEYCTPIEGQNTDILTDEECRVAAQELGQMYSHAWTGPGEHKYCSFADDSRSKVYFNKARMPSPTPFQNHRSVCHRVPPVIVLQACLPGDPKVAVNEAGAWAIAVYFLAGVWVVALWFVFILFAPEHKVRPIHHDEDDPYETAKFNNNLQETSHERTKRLLKTICKVIFKSVEAMAGAAIFFLSFAALVTVGSLKLPLDQPECAEAPRGDFGAIIDEPVRRFALVWCEQGAVASVCLAFLAFSYFLIAFAMSLGVVLKHHRDKSAKAYKKKLQQRREKSLDSGDAVEEGPDYGDGFRIQKMRPHEECPDAMFADLDGRVFDC